VSGEADGVSICHEDEGLGDGSAGGRDVASDHGDGYKDGDAPGIVKSLYSGLLWAVHRPVIILICSPPPWRRNT
jgi:hypothetical protein